MGRSEEIANTKNAYQKKLELYAVTAFLQREEVLQFRVLTDISLYIIHLPYTLEFPMFCSFLECFRLTGIAKRPYSASFIKGYFSEGAQEVKVEVGVYFMI